MVKFLYRVKGDPLPRAITIPYADMPADLITKLDDMYPYRQPSRGFLLLKEFRLDDEGLMFGVTYQVTEGEALSEQDVFDIVRDAHATYVCARDEVRLRKQQAELEKRRSEAEAAEAKLREQLCQLAEQREAVKEAREAATIEWRDGKAIVNLWDRLWTVSSLDYPRANRAPYSWAKEIHKVRSSRVSRDVFEGIHVEPGTVELTEGDRVFLLGSENPRQRRSPAQYEVLVLRGNRIEVTNIKTDARTPGWVLRIRDRVADLVQEVTGVTPESARARLDAVLDDMDEEEIQNLLDFILE